MGRRSPPDELEARRADLRVRLRATASPDERTHVLHALACGGDPEALAELRTIAASDSAYAWCAEAWVADLARR